MLARVLLALLGLLASLAMATPVSTASPSTATTSAAGDKLVFCHFMVSKTHVNMIQGTNPGNPDRDHQQPSKLKRL
jgi:hypothetical protein